jgi:hypothetical protein
MLAIISNKFFGLDDKNQKGFVANTTESKYWEVWSAVIPHHISGFRSSGMLRSVDGQLPFRDSLSVPPSRVKRSEKNPLGQLYP